ncbi:MAG: cytochrome c3 family protein [Vicinamibacteria bacterium]|nr:cytochrome c3 family protein [Vicinamibacteria bacterium]
MTLLKTLFISAFWLLADRGQARAAETSCLGCHPTARAALSGPMSTRAAERAFAHRAFGKAEGDRFFEASCSGCHVSSCNDCHGTEPHRDPRPKDDACLSCHRGYFVGWDYYGRAPREDHARYRRGAIANGEPVLKMLPDVHRERGMSCADCHPMASLHGGKTATRTCLDCHPNPSRTVPEHSFDAHMTKMECVACHSAWAPQEYGTFLVRPKTPEQQEAFAALPSAGPWKRSAYLRRQDAPPLGLNQRGKVSPIRPQFILFATDLSRGWENKLLAAEWKAFTPHTVRRGSVTCSGCHEAPRRYLLEADADRLHLLDKDGLPLRSFWSQTGQTVTNGSFFPLDRHTLMNRKTPEYVRQYLRQWQNLLDRAGPPSKR